MNPKISVIMPVYNVETYLRKSIESVLMQTLSDFELIIVNDGSTDKSEAICEEMSKIDQRLKVFHTEHNGVSSARNLGLKIAKGDYISFVDSDDFIHEEMYQILYDTAQKTEADLVVCDFKRVNAQELLKIEGFSNFEIKNYTNIQALYHLYNIQDGICKSGAGQTIKWITVWNKLYKRSLFSNIEFPERRIFEDELISHQILYRCNKITFIPLKLYYYVKRPQSILNSPFTKQKLDKVHALQHRVDFFKQVNDKKLYAMALSNYSDVFFWYYIKGKKDLVNISNELDLMKREYRKYFLCLMKNPYLTLKQKVIILLFTIVPIQIENRLIESNRRDT
ncbi:glycosyltransferase family 2 protein [Bacillus sp. AK128]